MYGLLALLPQSDAFRTLHARLNSIPTLALLQLEDPNSPAPPSSRSSKTKPLLDFPSLLKLFCERQARSLTAYPCPGIALRMLHLDVKDVAQTEEAPVHHVDHATRLPMCTGRCW